MRILIVTNLYPNPYQPNRGTFNRQQLRALAQRHSVAVIAPILWTDEIVARIKGRRLVNGRRQLNGDGIAVDHPCYLYPPRMLRRWYGSFFQSCVSRSFERLRGQFAPELVFALWAYPDGWAACQLARQAGLPVVVKIHGSDILTLQQYPGRRRRTIEVLHRADGIVAVSQDLANRVEALGVDRRWVRVVYDGIDETVFCPGQQGAARQKLGLELSQSLVLYVGNLVALKGLEVFVEACHYLVRRGSRFVSYLIGEGPLQRRLQRLVKHRGLEGHVRFVGSRPHAELADWYRAATVCVLPSYSEGVPIVLLEACACGTPFVASRVGGIPEIAHLGTHQLVEPGDSLALAQAIGEFISGSRIVPGNPRVAIRSHDQAASELIGFFEQILQLQRPYPETDRRAFLPTARIDS